MATMNAGKSGVVVGIAFLSLLAGCAQQQITRMEGQKPKQVCIVRHDAVKPEVIDALQEGFTKHGISTRVVPGVYELKHRVWQPRWKVDEVKGCDALGFYVVNWHWDLVLYMRFANIWMVTPDGSKKIGQATYDARASRIINARGKIVEMVDQMIAGSI